MSNEKEPALRRIIVDTDTGSDDVWAIIEALRATDIVRVEAITVVCGNFPLDLCVKNALLAVDAAGTYAPPVYRGMERPLLNPEAFYAPEVHGEDGLGGMDLPMPERRAEPGHAIDALIDLVMADPGQIEIVACGPLTNLAMAMLKEPRLAGSIKKAWILGGAAGGAGNMTPKAEYNVYADPEAAHIVLTSGVDALWVPWDSAAKQAEITPEDRARLLRCGDRAGEFCARCTKQLQEYYRAAKGRESYAVIDALVMTAALYPEVMEGVFRAGCSIELTQGELRGYFRIDRNGPPNTSVCPAVKAAPFKEKLFSLLGAGGEACPQRCKEVQDGN